MARRGRDPSIDQDEGLKIADAPGQPALSSKKHGGAVDGGRSKRRLDRPGRARGGKLTASERQSLPKSDFALPGKGMGPKGAGSGSYPIDTEVRARNALARVSQHGSPSEKAEVRAKVHRKFPDISEKRE